VSGCGSLAYSSGVGGIDTVAIFFPGCAANATPHITDTSTSANTIFTPLKNLDLFIFPHFVREICGIGIKPGFYLEIQTAE